MDHTTTVREVSGYRLRDVDFLQALMIPDSSDGIEIQTTMRSVSDKDVGAQGSKHFEVWTVTADNRWTQHAKGLISVEFEGSTSEPLKAAASNREIKGYTRRVIPADLFANLRALGITHGPLFQNMKTIVQSGSESRSVVTMTVPNTSVPKDLPRDHVLHPVTLDSVITAPYSAVPGAAARETAAKVPRSVGNFWVSSDISHRTRHLFTTSSSIIRDDSQGMAADVSVSNSDDGRIMLEMKNFTYQSLGRGLSLHQTESWQKELCNTVDWSLDISIRSSAIVESVEKQLSYNVDPAEGNFTQDLWRVCVYLIQKALSTIDRCDVDLMEPHHAKYYTWMNDVVQQATSGKLCTGSAEWLALHESERHRWIDQVAKARVDGEMICRLGSQLVAMLQGQTTPLEVMARDNLLSRFQSGTPRVKRTGSQLAGLLRHLVHKNPRARILEIGAGTGATTCHALEILGTAEDGGPHASLYHYTDVSADFFEAARETLSAWNDLLTFDVLDIERDPFAQGFTAGSYDIVIASRVLYATKSIPDTLNNVRGLLKPGGTFLLTEDVQCQVDVQFVNGLLPGWWLAEETERESNPLLSTLAWKHHLSLAGFAGPNITLHDCIDTEVSCSATLIATVPLPLSLNIGNTVIVTSKRAGAPPPDWLKDLQDSIATCAEGEDKNLPIVQDLESPTAVADWYADKICVFIGEIDEPILYDLDSKSLDGIRTMTTSCKGLLWITRGGAVDCERPELGLAPGFIRALRNEYVGRKLMTLDLDPNGPVWSKAGASAIVQVLQAAFSNPEDSAMIERGPAELEYAERDSVILVPRFYHDVARNKLLSLKTQENGPVEPFHQPNRPMCLHSDLLAFDDDSYANSYRDSLPPRLVEVEPKAYGATINGEHIAGLECAGVITRVGSEAAAQGYGVGDRILCVLRQSSFPSRAIVEWTSTVRIPTDLSFPEAASLPIAFLTAYFSLIEIARLRRTQSILIHDAAGDIGQVAIVIAQHIGAEIFSTSGSSEERELITQKYSIPADHLFNSRDASFGAVILAVTNNRGVDVILNSLTGPLMQESFNLVAPLGCFVEVGKHDLESNSNLAMKPFTRGFSFSAVDIPSLLEHRVMDVYRCLGELTRLVKARVVTPLTPIITRPMKDIVEASRLLKTESPMGKVVLTVSADEMVPAIPHTATAKLSPNASYLIVGGNGGLGQSVAHWMVSRGARNLVLLSRSAGKSEKMAALAEELREAGCSRVLPVSCDVSNEDDVANAIDTCAEEGLPPIRGIIHAAFVLHVSDSPCAMVKLHLQQSANRSIRTRS